MSPRPLSSSGHSSATPGQPGTVITRWLMAAAVLLLAYLCLSPTPAAAQGPFAFVVLADVRQYAGPGIYDSPDYFRGALEATTTLTDVAFLVAPGDMDPLEDVQWTITTTLSAGLPWYPLVGNHELPGGYEPYSGANMDFLRAFDYDANGIGVPPDVVRSGPSGCPETTFSFDYDLAHLVVLNEYCDEAGDTATDGDIPDHLYDWLVADLAASNRPFKFVFGHEPAYPQPDADNGRLRHTDDGLNQHSDHRDRFWSLLRQAGVTAYVCGHTHNYSVVRVNGVWQVDVGHARGAGDTGAPSTFVLFQVEGEVARMTTYRDGHSGTYDYDDIVHQQLLAGEQTFLPAISHR